MKKELCEILSLKSVITLLLTLMLCYLVLDERLGTEHFLPIVTMVFTYYFTRSKNKCNTEMEAKSNHEQNENN
jgi:hypothetical protein